MLVTLNGKTLYHIQNRNICTDGTCFDMFVYFDHEPNDADLLLAYELEFPDELNNKELLDEFLTSSEIYKINAEEL